MFFSGSISATAIYSSILWMLERARSGSSREMQQPPRGREVQSCKVPDCRSRTAIRRSLLRRAASELKLAQRLFSGFSSCAGDHLIGNVNA